jgi:hypothetical protein
MATEKSSISRIPDPGEIYAKVASVKLVAMNNLGEIFQVAVGLLHFMTT